MSIGAICFIVWIVGVVAFAIVDIRTSSRHTPFEPDLWVFWPLHVIVFFGITALYLGYRAACHVASLFTNGSEGQK